MPARPLFQSAMTPAALIGAAHFSIWFSTNFWRYSGVRRSGATTSTPISLRRATTAGVVMVATAALWGAFTIGAGVVFGKKNASQLSALNPVRPCSSALARLGSAGERSLVRIAIALTVLLSI